MDPADRATLVAELDEAFGGAADVTPSPSHDLHVLFSNLELPAPWKPSPTRGLAIFRNWPAERPLFYVAEEVVGETGQPPESNHAALHLGTTWRGFSWTFKWIGDNPVRAVQLWVTRFVERRT